MDWNLVEGNWKQVAGKVKEKWGKRTDDDLTTINGRRDQLEGKIQERYGLAKDQVKKDIDDWYGKQSCLPGLLPGVFVTSALLSTVLSIAKERSARGRGCQFPGSRVLPCSEEG